MGFYAVPKVKSVPVAEIVAYECKLEADAIIEVEARYELACYVKEICTKRAYTMWGLVKLLKKTPREAFTQLTQQYLQQTTSLALRGFVDAVIIKSKGGYASTFSLHKNWDRWWASGWWILSGWFYYYSKPYVNLFHVDDEDLPLYVNHEWEDKKQAEIFRERMRNLSCDT